jgi:hypothetical protein
VSRFPIYLPRGASRVGALQASLDGRLGHCDYSLFYMSEFGPSTPLDESPDADLQTDFRVVCQLGRLQLAEGEQFLRVIYCDEFLLGSNVDKDVPFLAKAHRPIEWRDARRLFGDGHKLCLVRKAKGLLERVDAADDHIVEDSLGEMVAITYEFEKFDPALFALMNAPMRMNKEFRGEKPEETKEEEEAADGEDHT